MSAGTMNSPTSDTAGSAALILAAGKGTRMGTNSPKALQTLLGEPMLAHVAAALSPLFPEKLWAVIGHGAELVEAAFAPSSKQNLPALRFVRQTEQLGTGHALMVALPDILQAGIEQLVVINGDMPLISSEMMRRILNESAGADLALASIILPNAGAYGRVVRDTANPTSQSSISQNSNGPTGACISVIEAKDYSTATHGPETGEINIGLYVLNLTTIGPLLSNLTTTNKSGEYYITDLVALAHAAHLCVRAVVCGDNPDLLGVNTPAELIRSESRLRAHIVQRHLEAGVILHQPESLVIGPFVQLEPGAELSGPGHILGHSRIASAATVGPFCHIRDSVIQAHAAIQPYSHIQDAEVGPRCTVGPYARLRPGALLEEAAHVGNFVELKKTRLGPGAKANHLSYLGDADIGPGVNIGAGTITCNYDGKSKFRTTIAAKAFIGSNTSLVAPVHVGENALVGAGSVITQDVPDNALAIARGQQVNKNKK